MKNWGYCTSIFVVGAHHTCNNTNTKPNMPKSKQKEEGERRSCEDIFKITRPITRGALLHDWQEHEIGLLWSLRPYHQNNRAWWQHLHHLVFRFRQTFKTPININWWSFLHLIFLTIDVCEQDYNQWSFVSNVFCLSNNWILKIHELFLD